MNTARFLSISRCLREQVKLLQREKGNWDNDFIPILMSNSGVPDMLLTWHFSTFCCICVFIPTTVLNGQVLFAIFAISIMFPCEVSAARKRKLGQRFHPDFILLPYKIDTGTLCLLQILQTRLVHSAMITMIFKWGTVPGRQ
jgi:hypothetical protein